MFNFGGGAKWATSPVRSREITPTYGGDNPSYPVKRTFTGPIGAITFTTSRGPCSNKITQDLHVSSILGCEFLPITIRIIEVKNRDSGFQKRSIILVVTLRLGGATS